MTSALSVENLGLTIGGAKILEGITLSVKQNETLGIIGPNGAGKTSFFNLLSGLREATTGSIYLGDKEITNLKPHQRAQAGIARTFQNIRLFSEMTAVENVMVGADARKTSSIPAALLRTKHQRLEEKESYDRSMELLALMGIADRASDAARNLPYGYQRRLEIARALATEPELLCLDEPAAGFNPAEKQQLNELIFAIRDRGYTVLLIEHDMSVVMNVSDRVVVLDFGKKIAEGLPNEVRSNPDVIAAYLGVPDDAA